MLKKVENAGKKGIASKRKPYKISPEDFFADTEKLRRQFAQLINCAEPNRNVLIPSVSYGMANVAANLPKKKGKVLIAKDQFPSNKYPWDDYQVELIDKPVDNSKSWTEAFIERITSDVAAVCLSHTHWVDGSLFELEKIREKATEADVALIIDGTQSIGALPFDVSKIKPDALVAAGYKWLFGPYSTGIAYYGELFDNGKPIENNWINREGSEKFGGLVNYTDNYHEGALRYEVGEHSNFILVPMLLEAVRQINRWTPQEITSYVKKISAEAIDELGDAGYKIEEAEKRASHLFGIRFDEKMDPERIQKSLKAHRVSVSFRGDAIRVSPHVYNDERDMRKLTIALTEAL